jgi:hypothetical protein
MARLTMKRCERPGKIVDRIPTLLEHLSGFGEPILQSGLDAQRKIVGDAEWGAVNRNPSEPSFGFSFGRPALWGEIFVRNGDYYAISLKQREQSSQLFLYAVTKEIPPAEFDRFTSLVSEVLKVKFEPYSYDSPDFNKLKEEVVESFRTPSTEEIGLARVLSNPALRSLAISIKQTGGLLLSDLPKQLKSADEAAVREIHGTLESSGLVASEVVVLCKNASRQVLRVPTAEAVAAMANAGARCACGRRVDEERQEKAISLTEAGVTLIDKSRWLSVLVYDDLVAAGVAPGRIIVEGTLGGDEVDCIAEISGELALFELKDKEFNLREAYSFGAKIGIVRPEHALVVTTSKVGGDAKQHLKRALSSSSGPQRRYGAYHERVPGSRVGYIEGIETLRGDISSMVSAIESADARTVLQEILDSVSLSADDLLGEMAADKPGPSRTSRRSQAAGTTEA